VGDLTKNFSRYEFECECGCGFAVADYDTVTILQAMADHFEAALRSRIVVEITGPNRCREHNETVQKEYDPEYVPYSSKSRHMTLGAVDFKLYYFNAGERVQIHPGQVYDYLNRKYPDRFGLGLYKNRVHFDPRRRKGRWDWT